MSKKKLFNLIEFLAHLLLLAGMSFLPYVNVTIDPSFEWAIDVLVPLGTYTFFGFMKQCPYLFATVFVVLIVLSALICLGSLLGKSPKKDGSVHVALSVIVLILGFLFYNFPYFETGYSVTALAPGKTISHVLLVAIVVFAVMKRSNIAFPKDESPTVITVHDSASNADELKKYKELLDSGVITQEEFDAKKKQLLGL